MPRIGKPILSTSVSISSGGMIWRIAFFDLGELLGAFLDAGADRVRTCIRIWPASTDGKEIAAEKGHQRK